MLGTTIAHYKITAKLGQGGMGEVYRATDTKLDREVAIKVLPQSVVQDKERLARFEREAKTLAQLNHPNIAAVFGLEQSGDTQALILELVEGEDLSARLKRGPLPLDEALEVCKQIGDALAAAHAKGIIHRDLKPGNIKLTTDGKVKVLDFGLAKALSEQSDTSSVSSLEDSPTITDAFTQPGTILGTAAYMSPEQARGKHVDKRTDIWAFGCVLYECLTGKKAFQGEDVTDTLAKIIQGAPDWTMLPQSTPATVQLLAKKCLVKDRKKRQQHIDDAIVDLEQAISDPSTSIIQLSGQALAASNKTNGSSGTWIACAVTLLIGFVAAWILKPQPSLPQEHATVVSDILLPHNFPINGYQNDNAFAISRQGDFLVYNLHDNGGGIQNHDLSTGDDFPVSGAQSYQEGHPFLSPDGAKLGMVMLDKLVTLPSKGGTPKTIVTKDVTWMSFLGADWSDQDSIVLSQDHMPLRLVQAEGGVPTTVTQLGEDRAHAFPQFLPGGKYVLFTVVPLTRARNHAEVLDLETGERAAIGVPESDFAMYVQSGHLLYSLGSDVYAIGFDLRTMKAKGSPVKVLQGVDANNQRLLLEVSDNGTLVYQDRSTSEKENVTLAWVDKEHQMEPFTQESGNWQSFSLSPDEKSVVIEEDGKIYLITKQGTSYETKQTLVEGDFRAIRPGWAPDGKSIFFTMEKDNKFGLYRIKTDFVSDPEHIWESEREMAADYITSDYAYVVLLPPSSFDIARLSLAKTKPDLEPLFNDDVHNEIWAQLSPDGGHIALVKAHPKGTMELFVSSKDKTSFTKIADNAWRPRWSKTDSGVFYKSANSIFLTRLRPDGDRLIPQEREEFCKLPSVLAGLQWEISNDGSRALIMIEKNYLTGDKGGEHSPSLTHLKIKTNWFTELNRLAPLENN